MRRFFAIVFLGLSGYGFSVTPFASGKLILDKKLATHAKGIRTLFLVVYDLESKRPMPYGAKKVELKKDASGVFYTFNLDSNSLNKMSYHGATPKKLRIKARLDKDGSAGMDQKGDITGELSPVELGSKGLTITLNKVK